MESRSTVRLGLAAGRVSFLAGLAVLLAGMALPVGTGGSRIAVRSSLPATSGEDEQLSAATVTITITTDGYGYDTRWRLGVNPYDYSDPNDPNQVVVASGGPYASFTTYIVPLTVNPGFCYDFVIFDGHGDGIDPPGGYSVTYEGEVLMSTLGAGWDGYVQRVDFVGGGCAPQPGACCFGDGTCQTIPGVGAQGQCFNAGGEWYGYGTDCVPGITCPQPPSCPGDSVFSQPGHWPDQNWTTGTSEQVSGLSRLENFSGLAGAITDLVWWGLESEYDGSGWRPCDESTPVFTITFYRDSSGAPGAVYGSAQTVTAVLQPEPPPRMMYGDFALKEYRAHLTTPVGLGSGWVSIVGGGSAACWFQWLSSGVGDGRSYLKSGTQFQLKNYDLGLCLESHPDPVGVGACCLDDYSCRLLTMDHCDRFMAGDCDCDEHVGFSDIDYFVVSIPSNEAAWRSRYMLNHGGELPPCSFANCDVNGDGTVGFKDIDPFVALIPSSSIVEWDWLGGGTTCDACPCNAVCPPGGQQEGENCGQNINGGCNVQPPVFSSLACGQTVCGSLWAEGGQRDEDWYQIVVGGTESRLLKLSVVAEVESVEFGFAEPNAPGVPGCEHWTGELDPAATGGACDPQTVTWCVSPGTYYAVIRPAEGVQAACPSLYTASLSCTYCVQLPGACCNDDGQCNPDQTEQICRASGGSWLGPGTTCVPNPCPPPEIGRCCYGNPVQCTVVSQSRCQTVYQGTWGGALTDCNTPCPPRLGETCADATIIPAAPFSVDVDNSAATADGPPGSCDHYSPLTPMRNDLWYVWTAGAQNGLATVRVTPTGYDAIVVVRSGCTGQPEVRCADSGFSGAMETIALPAVANATYYIQFGRAGQFAGGGPTRLELTWSGGSGACCFSNGTCVFQSGYACVNGGGTYLGDGIVCEPDNPCLGPGYCSAAGGCDEFISRVEIGSFGNNSTTCFGYSDYTSMSTDLRRGQGYAFKIYITGGYPEDRGAAWIDWDRNQVFATGEAITLTGTPGIGPYVGTITPAGNAPLGPTRLRVRVSYDETPYPCGPSDFGEVEDYTVNIVE